MNTCGELLNFFFNAIEIVAVLLPQDKIRLRFRANYLRRNRFNMKIKIKNLKKKLGKIEKKLYCISIILYFKFSE